jgi:hypothetical protein
MAGKKNHAAHLRENKGPQGRVQMRLRGGKTKGEIMNSEPIIPGWARVQLMGHASEIGYVRAENYGGIALLRVTSPAVEGDPPVAAGYQALPSAESSILVGGSAVYRIAPMSEADVLAALKGHRKIQYHDESGAPVGRALDDDIF